MWGIWWTKWLWGYGFPYILCSCHYHSSKSSHFFIHLSWCWMILAVESAVKWHRHTHTPHHTQTHTHTPHHTHTHHIHTTHTHTPHTHTHTHHTHVSLRIGEARLWTSEHTRMSAQNYWFALFIKILLRGTFNFYINFSFSLNAGYIIDVYKKTEVNVYMKLYII